ncbi:MAG: L,D-transpeptidase [Phycisphaerae bacterium]
MLAAGLLLGVLGVSGMPRSWAGSFRLAPLGTRVGPAAITLQNPHVVVVKSVRKLYLFDGDRLIRGYPVTLGLAPVGQKVQAGDGRTPEGRFRICAKNSNSANHRFLGISYPSPAVADRGLRDGLISVGEAQAIHEAHDAGRCPNWTTALGGALGLHGSAGPPGKRTAGCIALADRHVAELFDVLRIGDEIEILP